MSWSKPLYHGKAKLKDFYYCIDRGEFGWGECPYKSYKTTIQVIDDAGKPLSGATVTCETLRNDGSTYDMRQSVSGEDGSTFFYLKGGTYRIGARLGSYGSDSVDIYLNKKPQRVVLCLTRDGQKKPRPGGTAYNITGDPSFGGTKPENQHEEEDDPVYPPGIWKSVTMLNDNLIALIDRNDDLYTCFRTTYVPNNLNENTHGGFSTQLSLAMALLLLSRSFISLVTTKKSGRKKVYVARTVNANSASGALFRREIRRFLTDPLYLINNGLGSIMMIIGSVIILVNTRALRSVTADLPPVFGVDLLALAILAGICLFSSLTVISASTISLEGHSLWVLQSFPVRTETILISKAAVHILFAGVPSVILAVCAGIVIDLGWSTVLLALAALAFTALVCCFGLFLEVRNPRLDWTDESIAVKQNLNVLFAMLGGFGIAAVLTAASITVCVFLPVLAIPALAFETAVYAGLSILFFRLSVKFWPRLCES